MTLRIVLADDHAAFRRCLKTLLEQQPDLSVVREAAGGHSAIAAIQACRHTLPDVLILDMEMRDLSGLRAARDILERHPTLRILMLSWFDDLPFVNAACAAGCRGYMLKDDPLPELLHAIREIGAGRTCLSATLRAAQTSGDSISAFC
jgi:DNA-binding NarL/FixJ family response regulator